MPDGEECARMMNGNRFSPCVSILRLNLSLFLIFHFLKLPYVQLNFQPFEHLQWLNYSHYFLIHLYQKFDLHLRDKMAFYQK